MKVLIVDDESAIHEQLRTCIPWRELGWEIVGHAYNGEEARLLTEKHRPDLILTDIRMPLMDGLSFMEWVRRAELPAQIIVLSGYGEFAYSRSAFLLEACDYLLKPVNPTELLQALGRAVDYIERESKALTDRIHQRAVLSQGLTLMQDEFVSQIIGAALTDENEILIRAEQLKVALPEFAYAVAVVKFIDIDEQVALRYKGDRSAFHFAARNVIRESLGASSGASVFRMLQASNEYVCLYPMEGRKIGELETALLRLHAALSHCLKIHVRLGASSVKQRVDRLAAAYGEALSALESLRWEEPVPVALYGRRDEPARPDESGWTDSWDELGLMLDLLLETGGVRDEALLLQKLEESFAERTLSRMRGSDIKKASIRLLDKMQAGAGAREDIRQLAEEARVCVQEMKFHQAKELLRATISRLLVLGEERRMAKSGKQLIHVIRKYIDEHFRTVTLDDIAQRFYLNKNYFCTLFKTVTGESFMEYVTARRMEHAKRLLEVSDLKTYEIAEQVGYADQRYFSQVFRRYTGMQPTQYRALRKTGG